jgi:hypothetical protein
MASRLSAAAARFARRTLGTAVREWPRWRKAQWQRRHPAGAPATLGFVVGAQRSGTTMLLEALDRSRQTAVYHEYHSQAMDAFRLRPLPVIERLAATSAAQVMVLKPLTESQSVDVLLERFPDAKAIWMFRGYQDVANSAVAKWPGDNTRFANAVRDGRLAGLDWQAERINPEVLELVAHLAGGDLTEQEGAALFWYARNHLYFDRKLHDDPRVRLVEYEELVSDPLNAFPGVFGHLGLSFEPRFVEGVTASSLGRRRFGPINPEIEAHLEGMMERLRAAKRTQASVASRPAGASC